MSPSAWPRLACVCLLALCAAGALCEVLDDEGHTVLRVCVEVPELLAPGRLIPGENDCWVGVRVARRERLEARIRQWVPQAVG